MHNHLGILKPQGGIAYAKASVRELIITGPNQLS